MVYRRILNASLVTLVFSFYCTLYYIYIYILFGLPQIPSVPSGTTFSHLTRCLKPVKLLNSTILFTTGTIFSHFKGSWFLTSDKTSYSKFKICGHYLEIPQMFEAKLFGDLKPIPSSGPSGCWYEDWKVMGCLICTIMMIWCLWTLFGQIVCIKWKVTMI